MFLTKQAGIEVEGKGTDFSKKCYFEGGVAK
jgi:hypothetical protein